MNGVPQEQPYTSDVSTLEKELLNTYTPAEPNPSQTLTFFLTGATGFLGAYILNDLLSRSHTRVIVHVRAESEASGLERIQSTCKAYGIWSEGWSSRLSCVVGDLQKANLGLSTGAWEKVAIEADIVIHNGAKVHWVLPCKPPVDSGATRNKSCYLTTSGNMLANEQQMTPSNPPTSSAHSLACLSAQPANPNPSLSSAPPVSSTQTTISRYRKRALLSLNLTTSKAAERD